MLFEGHIDVLALRQCVDGALQLLGLKGEPLGNEMTWPTSTTKEGMLTFLPSTVMWPWRTN